MQSQLISTCDQAQVAAPVRRSHPRFLEFAVHARADLRRREVERYIGARFARGHGACIDHFLPFLVTQSQAGRICAAVGLAPASAGPMFAESYLPRPIEQIVTDVHGVAPRRGDILEIGNLVSSWRGSSLLLFVFLSELVDRLGFRWVLFTATREVERVLARLEYAPRVLASADPQRVANAGANWGRYYERDPRVMFGEVQPAVAQARKKRLYRTIARAMSAQVDALTTEFRAQLREQKIAAMAPTANG
jgi:hypothetical protein